MFVSIDLCLVPIESELHFLLIKECIEIIKNEGLTYELGATEPHQKVIGMKYLNVLENAMKNS